MWVVGGWDWGEGGVRSGDAERPPVEPTACVEVWTSLASVTRYGRPPGPSVACAFVSRTSKTFGVEIHAVGLREHRPDATDGRAEPTEVVVADFIVWYRMTGALGSVGAETPRSFVETTSP